MDCKTWFTIINFGLVVLIWLVQLIIYPSLAHISEADFISWHRRYVRTISIIVTPLMIAQMLLAAEMLNRDRNLPHMLIVLCIAIIWIASFALSVPCHKALQQHGKNQTVIHRLVGTNWIRTMLWSAIFLLGLLGH